MPPTEDPLHKLAYIQQLMGGPPPPQESLQSLLGAVQTLYGLQHEPQRFAHEDAQTRLVNAQADRYGSENETEAVMRQPRLDQLNAQTSGLRASTEGQGYANEQGRLQTQAMPTVIDQHRRAGEAGIDATNMQTELGKVSATKGRAEVLGFGKAAGMSKDEQKYVDLYGIMPPMQPKVAYGSTASAISAVPPVDGLTPDMLADPKMLALATQLHTQQIAADPAVIAAAAAKTQVKEAMLRKLHPDYYKYLDNYSQEPIY